MTASDIVVIDDDSGVRALLQDCLQLDGFVVRAAADGAEGLGLLTEMQPSCVVLDVMMPQLNGHSVLRLLRERHGFNLPVIMLTAASGDDQVWQAWSGGIDCFMAKPFDMDALLQQVRSLCAPAASSARAIRRLDVPTPQDRACLTQGRTRQLGRPSLHLALAATVSWWPSPAGTCAGPARSRVGGSRLRGWLEAAASPGV